jgi:hypothetical protein
MPRVKKPGVDTGDSPIDLSPDANPTVN